MRTLVMVAVSCFMFVPRTALTADYYDFSYSVLGFGNKAVVSTSGPLMRSAERAHLMETRKLYTVVSSLHL